MNLLVVGFFFDVTNATFVLAMEHRYSITILNQMN